MKGSVIATYNRSGDREAAGNDDQDKDIATIRFARKETAVIYENRNFEEPYITDNNSCI